MDFRAPITSGYHKKPSPKYKKLFWLVVEAFQQNLCLGILHRNFGPEPLSSLFSNLRNDTGKLSKQKQNLSEISLKNKMSLSTPSN